MPAVKIDDSVDPPHYEKTSYKMGTHFMCKGCSVFFSNPKLFNKVAVDERKLERDIAERNSLIDLILKMEVDWGKELKELKDEELKRSGQQTGVSG